MLRISLVFGFSALLTACGSANFNSLLVSKAQSQALDQLLTRAQYEYDQGNNDKALELTSEALQISPYEEKTLVLRSYAYLSKAGLDAFALSKNLIKQSETKTTTTSTTTASTDATSSNLNSLASLIGLTTADFDLLGTANEDTGTKVYYPKSRTQAREAASAIIENINLAVETLCPIIQAGAPKDPTKDPRHSCEATPLPIQGRAKSHFAWALAHLGEAIAFYSVVLFDDKAVDASGKAKGPNLQRVSAGLNQQGDLPTFLRGLTTLTTAINNIFPTDPTASADSMLNAMFNDLTVTSLAFTAMGGVPDSVTNSITASITSLKANVSKVSSTTDKTATSDASKENAAIRNALTTSVAADLTTKIKGITDPTQKSSACTLFKQINSDPAKLPSGC